MSNYLTGNFSCLVDQGKVRKTNEDFSMGAINAYGNVILCVADGMGGAKKGDYASSTLVKYIVKNFQGLDKEFKNSKAMKKWLYKIILEANKKIYTKANKSLDFKGMGSTLSVCLIVKDILITAQVGDSRIYILKDNKLSQLSVDQSYVNYLVHNHYINADDASSHKERHKLTNAIGTKSKVNADINEYHYEKERLLLCSDGLYNNVSFEDLESILRGNDSLDKKVMQLIAFGNANGGSDNMAVLIWECSF